MSTYTQRGVKFIKPKPTWRRLHALCISDDPLELRLPAICEALEAGDDPNELGGYEHNPGIRRPLHYAIDLYAQPLKGLKANLAIVELLLQYGADPRLLDLPASSCSPIEELESWFRAYDSDHSRWEPEDLEIYPFFNAALGLMEAQAEELDGEPHVSIRMKHR